MSIRHQNHNVSASTAGQFTVPPDSVGYCVDNFVRGLQIHRVLSYWAMSMLLVVSVHAQRLVGDAPELRGIDIKEHLGERIPLSLKFQDESGKSVRLGDMFVDGKPVILTLAYYECPMLCTFVLNGLSKAVKELAWVPGNEYRMLTVSIDPNETSDLASAKRSRYVENIGKGDIGRGWSFWTGDDDPIKRLADTVGFHYFYDEKQDEFAHPAVVFILTAEGVISRYLYGINYSETDLRLALLEASEGKIGNIVDRVLLYCYHYDPQGKRYAIMAMNVMRLGGALTVTFLGLLLASLWLKERRSKRTAGLIHTGN